MTASEKPSTSVCTSPHAPTSQVVTALALPTTSPDESIATPFIEVVPTSIPMTTSRCIEFMMPPATQGVRLNLAQ